jgi:hypothetical protein
MFVKMEDATGPVCVNMESGLRFRPHVKNGLAAGVNIVFPDGGTNITVRGDYDRLCVTVDAIPHGNVRE